MKTRNYATLMSARKKRIIFLISEGFDAGYAGKVRECIKAHRFRTDAQPQSIEAKILFDADKIDATGTLGIARTLLYNGKTSEPLYSLKPDGQVSDGSEDTAPSFFQEYKYKLEGLYNLFYTNRGAQIAAERQASAKAFYNSMLHEVKSSYINGQELFRKHVTGQESDAGLDPVGRCKAEGISHNKAAAAKVYDV
jgi:uncharacterized protein